MLLAAIVTFACLKTAIGLITACSNTFMELFPGKLGYRTCCVLVAGVSFLIGNVGLTQIIQLAVPILMLLYPMAITLILSAFACALFGKDRRLYRWPMVLAGFAAFGDMLSALPKGVTEPGRRPEPAGTLSSAAPVQPGHELAAARSGGPGGSRGSCEVFGAESLNFCEN